MPSGTAGWDSEPRRRSIETLTNRNLSVVPGPVRGDRSSAPTLWLKAQMARFSDGAAHGERRSAVIEVLQSMPLAPMLHHTRDETDARVAELIEIERGTRSSDTPYGEWLSSGSITLDVMPYFARRRPVTSLVQVLLPELDDVDPVVDDVAQLVGALAPGLGPSDAGDEATRRLLDRFGQDSVGIATISILFQTHDATAALIGQALAIDEPGCSAGDRVWWAVHHCAPVRSTVRFAADATGAAAQPEPIHVDLDLPGPTPLTFGAGDHQCPGRTLATLLAEAIITPLVARNWHPRAVEPEPRPNLNLPARVVGRIDTTA